MSDEIKKQLNGVGSYIFKGAVGIILFFALQMVNDMKDSMKEIHGNVKVIGETVIRLEENAKSTVRELERLDRTKADKHSNGK